MEIPVGGDIGDEVYQQPSGSALPLFITVI